MKYILPFVIGIWLISCDQRAGKEESQKSDLKEKSAQFDWLVGEWERSNGEPDKQTYEYWDKTHDTIYSGLGYTILKEDTTFKEHLRLVKVDENWRLHVLSKEQGIATKFEVTSMSQDGFVAENPNNEFPKKIEYFREKETLKARISNSEMEVLFEFNPIHK